MRKIALTAILVFATAFPAFACGGPVDVADNVKAQIENIDGYLKNPQRLKADRSFVKSSAEVPDLDAATLSRVRALRNQSSDLLARALAQRAKTGPRSPLAARQLQTADEKAGEALLALGVPPVVSPGALQRCGVHGGKSPAS